MAQYVMDAPYRAERVMSMEVIAMNGLSPRFLIAHVFDGTNHL